MAACLAGAVLAGCGLAACGAERVAAPLESTGGSGARLQGLTLWEERDLQPSLELRARSANFQPRTQLAVLQDLELRFELPEQDLRGGVLTAARGRLDATTRLLSLEGGITLRDAQGRTLQSAAATYHLDSRRLEVPGQTLAKSARGTARAGRAVADLRGESLVLEGGVDAEVVP